MGRNRRGKGEGSIYRRKDGYYVGSVEVGREWSEAKGKMVRRQARVVRKSRSAVVEALGELKGQVDAGVVPDRKRKVGEFLVWWLDNVVAGTVGDSTLGQYRTAATQWVIPFVGDERLYRLRMVHVAQMMSALAKKGVGASSQVQALSVLKRALDLAVASDFMVKNPAAGVHPPTVEPKTDDTPEVEEVDAILAAAKTDRLYALAWMALKYGMRQGELIGLRWSNVSDDAITIVRETAKGRSERTLPVLPEAKAVLAAHRAAQEAERADADHWVGDDWVFTKANGAKLAPRQVLDWWHGLTAKAKVRRCRFHASRHAAATLLFEMGVDIDTVAAILGHSSAGTTRKVYLRTRQDIKRRGLLKVLPPAAEQAVTGEAEPIAA